MSRATAPCARAPGGSMRAPGSRCIFTVLAISGGRGPLAGWLAGWLKNPVHMQAGSPECMQAALNACMNSEKWLAASQPFCGPRMADIYGQDSENALAAWRAHGPPRRARARGSRMGYYYHSMNSILGPVRARARQQIKISPKSGTPVPFCSENGYPDCRY